MTPSNRNDVFRLDWLDHQEGAKVEHSKAFRDRPWCIYIPGRDPLRSMSLRSAIDRAMRLERKMNEKGNVDG